MSFLSPRSLARFEPLGDLGDFTQALRQLGCEATDAWGATHRPATACVAALTEAAAWGDAPPPRPETPGCAPSLARLVSRLRAGGLIVVRVSAAPVPPDEAEALRQALQAVAGPAHFGLLLVSGRGDPACAGTLSAPVHVWRQGWVGHLAPAEAPWRIDARGWRQLLERALDAWPEDRPAALLAPVNPPLPGPVADAPVPPPSPPVEPQALAFPEGGSGARQRHLAAGGQVQLVSASVWSRQFGSGFRLHASCEPQAPARLLWSGLRLVVPDPVLNVTFGLAVPQSVPVLVDLQVTAQGRRVALWSGWAGPERTQAQLALPDGLGSVDIQIEARFVHRAEHNGYAVIDIDAAVLAPAAPGPEAG